MALLRKLFWLALFLAATFSFVVLFEHGHTDFVKNAKTEFANFKNFTGYSVERKKDTSDQVGQ